MILNSPYISGSLTVTGNTTLQGALTVTGSLSGTASTASFALTLGGTGSVGFATTGAFTATSGSASSRLTQIEQVYATTGSNSFRATQSITGSLTVTGQIVAQTLNVQQVTSSIVYSSGSNVFGCDINSRQTFTGSFYQTGSTAYLSSRLGVGTINNGAMQFSDASNSILLQSVAVSSGTNLVSSNSDNSKYVNIWSGHSTAATAIGTSLTNCLTFGQWQCANGSTGYIERMRFTQDGIACFACQICAPSMAISGTFSDTTPLICITGTGTGTYQRVISVINPGMAVGNDLMIQMGSALSCRNAGQIYFHTDGAGCVTNRVSIGLFQIDNVLNVNGCANVGIGTVSPGTSLMVTRNVPDTNWGTVALFDSQTSAAGVGGVLTFGGFKCSQTSACSIFARIIGAKENATTGDECGYLSIQTNNNLTYVERIRVASSGITSFSNIICAPNAVINCLGVGGTWNTLGGAYQPLQVKATSGNAGVWIENGTDDSGLYINHSSTAALIGGSYRATAGYKDIEFQTAGSTRMIIRCAGPVIFQNNVCINGAGYGLQFTGGNNRIYFGACRGLEGDTSGANLQIGENYAKATAQTHLQLNCGTAGGSPKLFFGTEGSETAGAKAIYLDTYWMVIQPHTNEGLRIRAVNASGTQYTIAKFYGTSNFSLDQYSNGTLSVSSGVVVSSSDKNMKIDDGGIDTALPKIMCLNPRYFYWKPETCLNSCDRQLGFYAQDVSAVLGEEVANQSHNCSWGIYDRGIIAMLTKGMQEQQCIINSLKTCLGIS